jgi:hypothetical protein
MVEELNLKGKWWLPDRDNEKFEGTLTFDHQHQRGVLSIISGSIFEIDEIGNKDKHDIILGETSEGQKVTLNDCERRASHHHSHAPSEYSITTKNILLGWHFNRPEDIVFSSIYVTYRGDKINSWIKNVYAEALSKSRDSVEARIGDEYVISVTAKRRSSYWSEGEVHKERHYLEYCIEIESLKEKHLEEYRRVNSTVFDFLNFVIPQEVHIESIHGVLQNMELSKENILPSEQQEEIIIFYASAIKEMFKSPYRKQQLFPHDESQRGSIPELFQKYVQKWFEISEEIRPLFDLYFGVMYNSEMYIEFKFLGLAHALESYHRYCKRYSKEQTPPNWENEIKIIHKFYPYIPTRCLGKIKECYNPDLRKRVTEVYGEYSDIADIHFNFKHQEFFSRKVTKTRNYYTHWSKGKEKDVAYGDDLFLLTQDLQFLLELCIMTELGFSKEDIVRIYP